MLPVGARVVGVVAALRVPFWLGRRRLLRLLEPHPQTGADRPNSSLRRGDSALAVRTSRWALRQLARLPRSLWRTTCLYRSVAECLVLHHYRVPAQLRIGVRSDAAAAGSITAHAWVVRHDGNPVPPMADRWSALSAPLRGGSGGRPHNTEPVSSSLGD